MVRVGAPVGLFVVATFLLFGQPVLDIFSLDHANFTQVSVGHHLTGLTHHGIAGVVVGQAEDHTGTLGNAGQFQGIIQVTFDGGIYLGWFQSFNVAEAAEKPYQFDLTAEFTVAHEVLRLRTSFAPQGALGNFSPPALSVGQIGTALDGFNLLAESETGGNQ